MTRRSDSVLAQFARFALIAFWAACALIVLLDPIKYTDTDCWIHLSGGQYFWEHGRPVQDSYFSFLEPPRPWLSYAWGFQALIYLVYSAGGYFGLLAFRTVLFAALGALVLKFLLRRVPGEPEAPAGWVAGIGFLVGLSVLFRYLNVRPHMFSYVFIAAFLYILEFHPRRAWWLPVIGIAWMNVHGIAYPVMLMILGAYSLEYVVRRWRGRHDPALEQRMFVPTVLTMATVYATPLGARLLEAPARSLDYLKHYVGELVAPTFSEMTTLSVKMFTPSSWTVTNVLVLAALLAFVTACVSRRLRVSHAVLFMGAAALLVRGQRFTYEFALLSLPLLRAHPVLLRLGKGRAFASHAAAWVAALVLLLMPISFLNSLTAWRGAYPFTTASLPEGVCLFLLQADASGKVVNTPNSGGYLRWRLYPKYKILIDMDSYFEDDDFYVSRELFFDAQVLRQFLAEHDPSFITVPVTLSGFRAMMTEHPEFVAVFLDDAELLYANERHYPELVAQYRLEVLTPEVLDEAVEDLIADESKIEGIIRESERMLRIYPGGANLHHLMGTIRIKQGDFAAARRHADALLKQFPELPLGYLLLGDALKGLGQPELALRAYDASKPRAGLTPVTTYRKIGELYYEAGKYPQAYRELLKAIDPLERGVPVEDLLVLTRAAARSGHAREAKALFTFLLDFRVDPDDAGLVATIEEAMREAGITREDLKPRAPDHA